MRNSDWQCMYILPHITKCRQKLTPPPPPYHQKAINADGADEPIFKIFVLRWRLIITKAIHIRCYAGYGQNILILSLSLYNIAYKTNVYVGYSILNQSLMNLDWNIYRKHKTFLLTLHILEILFLDHYMTNFYNGGKAQCMILLKVSIIEYLKKIAPLKIIWLSYP